MYFQVLFIDGGVQKFITVSKNDMKIFLPNLNEHSNIFIILANNLLLLDLRKEIFALNYG